MNVRSSLVFLMLLRAALHAQLQPLIVDWGHDWGNGWYRQAPNQDANAAWRPLATEDLNGNGSTDDDHIGGWAFDPETPLSPVNVIYDDSFPSARFYGAAIVTVTDIPKNDDGARVRARAPTEGHINQNHELRDDWNLMCFPIINREPEKARYAGALLVYWDKKDFLNGGAASRVSMDADSMVGVFVSRYWGGIHWGRWIIRNQGVFYVSEATFAGQTEPFDLQQGEGSPNGARNPVVRRTHVIRPTETRWALYKPEAPHKVFFEGGTFENREFNDVDAIGFLAQRDMSVGHPVAGGLWNLPHGIGEPIALKFNAVQARARVHRPERSSDIVTMLPVEGEQGVAFHMAATEVTYQQWIQVRKWAITNQRARAFTEWSEHMEIGGYAFDRDGAPGSIETGRTERHRLDEPVTMLSWHDAALWCNALSELEGLTPAYYADPAHTQVLRRIFDRSKLEARDHRPVVFWKQDANGYRLPTAREFAHAATSRPADAPESEQAWVAANSGGRTQPAGGKRANGHGLHDLIGNVSEYVWDARSFVLTPGESPTFMVLGGSFRYPDTDLADTLMPFPHRPFEGSYTIGFRPVRNGNGRLPEQVKPVPLRVQKPEAVLAPQRAVSAAELRQMLGKMLPQQKADGAGSLPENDNMERNYPAENPYNLHIAGTPVPYRAWNLLRLWAESQGGYRFNHPGDPGSVQYRVDAPAGLERHVDEPVTHITWLDAVVWCNALSELFGLDPVYVHAKSNEVLRDAGSHRVDTYEEYAYANTGRYTNRPVDTAALISVRVLANQNGFRLPTLAEMQSVDDKSSGGDAGWFRNNSELRTHPVGGKAANARGLFDVGGNVQEWTYGGNNLFGQVRFGTSYADHPGVYPHSMTRMESPFAARHYVGFRPVRRAP